MNLPRITILAAALVAASSAGIANAESASPEMPMPQYLSKYAHILKIADAPKVCAPGITRCGADGYVERCDYDGTGWRQTVQHCK